MATLHVKVKDRATDREMVLTVSGPHTKESVKEYVEKMPGSHGGTHPGFEVLEVLDKHPDEQVAAEQPK